MKYRKKPVTIDALQWEGTCKFSAIREMSKFLNDTNEIIGDENITNPTLKDVEQAILEKDEYTIDSPTYKLFVFGGEDKNVKLIIKTLEGEMHVSPGDYVIRGVEGEYYPCKPDIFEKTYEPVND